MENRHRNDRAFSLIEITVVMAIVAMLVAGVTVGARALAKSELRGAAARLAGAMRFAFDRANATGQFYRLVFDFEGSTVTLEMSEGRALLSREGDEDAKGDAATRREDSSEQSSGQIAELGGLELPRRPPAAFQAFTGAGYRPVKLGRAQIRGVWTPRHVEPLSGGKASLFYFPQGFGEEAMVYLGDGNDVFTLEQRGLTGRVRLLAYRAEIERDRGERDDLGDRLQ